MTVTAAPARRELLLAAAAELFAAHGYHDVGIDDIGNAAGISGPGVYRHFASKQAILEALCERGIDTMLEGVQCISAQQEDPARALQAMVGLHVDFAVQRRVLIGVWVREQRALSPDVRRSLRRRQRAYEQPWRQVLSQLREDLDDAEVAVAVTATLTMLNATAVVDPTVPAERLRVLLRRMAWSALVVR